VAALAAAGCSSSTGNAPDVNPTDPTTGNLNPGTGSATPAATAALFQPAQGIFPFPNDLYFSGTTDGTINIQPANGLIPNQVGLNALDGWSTTAPIRIRFGGALNPASFSAANIRVIQVRISNTNKSVLGVTAALTYGTDFSASVATDAGVGPTILEITPLKPLQPSSGPAAPGAPLPDGTGYLVLLTNGIQMVGGAAATADTDYATIKTTLGATLSPASAANCAVLPNAPMQGACGLTLSHLLVGGALGLNPANVIVSFHFTTVAARDTLRALGQIITLSPPSAIAVAPTAIPLANFGVTAPATARVGTVTVPYYSYIPATAAPGVISTDGLTLRTAWRAANPPPAPLTDAAGEFNLTRFNPIPLKRADKAIPLLVIVPTSTKPAEGWPVVIFQHGITRNRVDALALAQAFTSQGWAIAAVDLPLHGLTNSSPSDPLFPLYQPTNEQTFNLDLVVNATGASGPDSIIDATGTHFINLAYPLASRDNLRQGVVNLLALTRALPTLDLDANAATPDIDATRIAFIGQSLGSIVGIGYGAVLPGAPALVRTMTFSVPGGGVASLLQSSASFGPRINAGLQGQGLLPGTSLYAQYFRDVQNIVDAGDPLNFITQTVAQRSIYIQQVVGGGTAVPVTCPGILPDQVIPNSATAKLLTAAGSTALPRVPPGPRFGSGYVNFITGDHGALLSPAACGAATVEMQTQAATFTISGNPPPNTIAPNPAIVVSNAAVGTVVQP
jgi:dienelactone hydrolase